MGAAAVPRVSLAIAPAIAASIRDRLDVIAAEMVEEIQRRIPEYARPGDPAYPRTVKAGVSVALTHFVDLLERPADQDGRWRDMFAAIGAGELHEGRSLDSLQAAIRLCARLGCRWLMDLAAADGAPLATVGTLTEVVFGYLDEVADASAEGYARAQSAAGDPERLRRHLIDLLLADSPVAAEAVAAAARAAGWPVPARVAVVAVRADPRSRPVLAPDILADFDGAEPCLIVPDPDRPAQRRTLRGQLAGRAAAVGPAVPVDRAARSLRWARQALALTTRGVLTGPGPVWCVDHLATLAAFQDEDLLGVLIERRLTPLSGLRPAQREPLAATLLAWLQLDRNARDVAARLHIHPQTVRYRLRQLDRLFGPALRDPALRFELELALRAAAALSATDKSSVPA
jgi:hypothetical protein